MHRLSHSRHSPPGAPARHRPEGQLASRAPGRPMPPSAAWLRPEAQTRVQHQTSGGSRAAMSAPVAEAEACTATLQPRLGREVLVDRCCIRQSHCLHIQCRCRWGPRVTERGSPSICRSTGRAAARPTAAPLRPRPIDSSAAEEDRRPGCTRRLSTSGSTRRRMSGVGDWKRPDTGASWRRKRTSGMQPSAPWVVRRALAGPKVRTPPPRWAPSTAVPVWASRFGPA